MEGKGHEETRKGETRQTRFANEPPENVREAQTHRAYLITALREFNRWANTGYILHFFYTRL